MARIHDFHNQMLHASYTDNAFYPVMSVEGGRDLDAGITRRRNVVNCAVDTTLTEAQSGSLVLFTAADVDITLPAIVAANVGMWFEFGTTISATDQGIIAQTGDLLLGGLAIIDNDDTGATSATFAPNGSSDLLITMNGTTTGGEDTGSTMRLTATSATGWYVSGVLVGSGEIATPFS